VVAQDHHSNEHPSRRVARSQRVSNQSYVFVVYLHIFLFILAAAETCHKNMAEKVSADFWSGQFGQKSEIGTNPDPVPYDKFLNSIEKLWCNLPQIARVYEKYLV
jgi:hypothetical protein